MLRAIQPLFLPATFVTLGLLGCALLLFFRKQRAARIAVVTVLLVWYGLSTEPFPTLVVGVLERRVPAAQLADLTGVEAIVILAGSSSYGGRDVGAELNGAAWRRLWRGVRVHRELNGKVPIVFSGGGPPDHKGASGPAALAAATSWGVPAEQFWLEDLSGNTMASGVEVKQLLDQRFGPRRRHRVVLVTSAWHMPRAVQAYQRLDIETAPVPSDFLATTPIGFRSFIPTYEAFMKSSIAFYEVLGIVGYRMGVRG